MPYEPLQPSLQPTLLTPEPTPEPDQLPEQPAELDQEPEPPTEPQPEPLSEPENEPYSEQQGPTEGPQKRAKKPPSKEPVSADLSEHHILEGSRTRRSTSRTIGALLGRILAAEGMKESDPSQLRPPRHHNKLKYHIHGREFNDAELRELAKLAANDTYEEVPEEDANVQNIRPIDLVWVYSYKMTTIGQNLPKARLCVRGDLQPENDLDTYAATLASRSYRCLLAIANKWGLIIIQLDAMAAFTNSDLDELVYVKLPPGYQRRGTLWKLRKALYGLRRSPLLWYRLVRSKLKELGLNVINEDLCIATNRRIIVFWHVDDINVMFYPRDLNEATELQNSLRKQFELTGGKPISNFLKIDLRRNPIQRKLWICQQRYVETIAHRYGINTIERLPSTTLPSKPLPLCPDPSEYQATRAEKKLYLSKVASALYAAI